MSPAQEVSDPGQRQEPWQGWRLILEGLQGPLFRVKLGRRGGGLGRRYQCGKGSEASCEKDGNSEGGVQVSALGDVLPRFPRAGRKSPLP